MIFKSVKTAFTEEINERPISTFTVEMRHGFLKVLVTGQIHSKSATDINQNIIEHFVRDAILYIPYRHPLHFYIRHIILWSLVYCQWFGGHSGLAWLQTTDSVLMRCHQSFFL